MRWNLDWNSIFPEFLHQYKCLAIAMGDAVIHVVSGEVEEASSCDCWTRSSSLSEYLIVACREGRDESNDLVAAVYMDDMDKDIASEWAGENNDVKY